MNKKNFLKNLSIILWLRKKSLVVAFHGFISKDICVFLTQASNHVILWLISIAGKELSWLLLTPNDFPAEGGSAKVGWLYHFCQMEGEKQNENNKCVGT